MSEPSTARGDSASEIRRQMKSRRRTLDAATRSGNADRVAHHLLDVPQILAARTIGAYVAVDGELDPEPSLGLLTAVRYLPLVGDDFSMEFRLASDEYPLIPNRYGIDEPPPSAPRTEPGDLDVVLVPLVAFDRHGSRIGMGAGYYDRCFAFRQTQKTAPLLVGVAHGFQEVAAIESQPWDVALDMVVTEQGIVAGEIGA